jgi:acyl-homoserine-lactone acylase
MDAWADGLNYFLATHPQVKPRLDHALPAVETMCFTEGSIGGDIESIPLTQLQAFYEQRAIAMTGASATCRYANRPAPTASPSRRN